MGENKCGIFHVSTKLFTQGGNLSRTQKSKILYVVAVACLIGILLGGWALSDWSEWFLAVAIVVILIPGRVQGHYWRAFFRGRRFQAQQDWKKAINEYQQFLADIDRRPGSSDFYG